MSDTVHGNPGDIGKHIQKVVSSHKTLTHLLEDHGLDGATVSNFGENNFGWYNTAKLEALHVLDHRWHYDEVLRVEARTATA